MYFSILECLLISYINPANHTPGVQIGHSMGVIYSHRLVIKTLSKIFSETIRITTQVSGIDLLSLLLEVYYFTALLINFSPDAKT